MKFSRIVCADNVNLTPETYSQIKLLSEQAFFPCTDVDPQDEQEMCSRIGDADGVLISWRTRLGENVLSQCPSLKYIGLCASKYTNVDAGNIDIKAARRLGITVAAVGQYGDEATTEFIFCSLLNLCRGFEKIQWRDMPCELYGKKLGIIGLGEMGQHVMRLALGFGMKVVYFSRTRKPACEALGVQYVSKSELLSSSNIISLHVPKGIPILSAKEFSDIPAHTILVNTCLGRVFAPEDFAVWIKKQTNIAIMDESADLAYRQFRDLPNVIYPLVVAGRTIESRERLSTQVLANIQAFLLGSPQNTI